MSSIEALIENLPDAESANRFFSQMAETFPSAAKKLLKNEGLLSDILTIFAFSPFLAATVLQNPDYTAWLNRQRFSIKVRGKDEILESLARFALTNSEIETNVLLARFRRRELLRIYLRDIRNLATIAEITEEISNLADAVLEYALRIARQELDNRYGTPLEIDGKGRAKQAGFCVVALGKLGSKELNYASDIDLLFLYSNDGSTSGQGTRGAVTNREYFVKLAESVTKLVGGQSGEGASYRVDLRLRPNGRVGALAISLNEAINYYQNSARAWERQVLIRSRACAGEAKIFRDFFQRVQANVFSKDETIENALENVRLSKEKINVEKISGKKFDVKLGRGGIREIEFIAQALQLAYGGADEWLRAPHTLISLSRLADRKLLTENDLTELFEAYGFLRRVEHRLQMENGLQTHLVPEDKEKRFLLAKRLNFNRLEQFDASLLTHSQNVNRIFTRVFGETNKAKSIAETGFAPAKPAERLKNALDDQIAENQQKFYGVPRVARAGELLFKGATQNLIETQSDRTIKLILSSLEKFGGQIELGDETFKTLEALAETAPHFAGTLAANPALIKNLPDINANFHEKNYLQIFHSAVENEVSFKNELAILRKNWARFLLEIVVLDIFEKISLADAKRLQTNLAEASIEGALFVTRRELERRFSAETKDFSFAVLGLGKLGGKGMDYGSDLDLILIYDEEKKLPVENLTRAEFYSRAVEIFVASLSSLTREGHLYRVDLRLRPDGKNGAASMGRTSFLNYLKERAAIWEWLAYVKIRGVAGDLDLADETENRARKTIHENAQQLRTGISQFEILRDETRRIRNRLEEEKSKTGKGREIDIKFGAGGMLDVYFAMRFLQLRDNVPDDTENRSTQFMLKQLRENDSLSEEDFQNFSNGYEFLSEIDHNLRLTIGRSTRLPPANQTALQTIVKRMRLASPKELLEQLTFHRLNIRASFENVLGN